MRQLSERHERILSDDVEDRSVGGGGRCGGGGAVVAGELQVGGRGGRGGVSQGVDGGAAGSTGWMQVVNPKGLSDLALDFRAGNAGVHWKACLSCDCGEHEHHPLDAFLSKIGVADAVPKRVTVRSTRGAPHAGVAARGKGVGGRDKGEEEGGGKYLLRHHISGIKTFS